MNKCGDPKCSTCSSTPCWWESGLSAGKVREYFVNGLTATLGPIGPGQWSGDVPAGQEVSSAPAYITLDATRGAGIVRLTHADGQVVLEHGKPVRVGTTISVQFSGSDRTSVACLLISDRPVHLPAARHRDVGRRNVNLQTVVPPLAPTADGVVYTPSTGGLYVVARAAAASAIMIWGLYDPADGSTPVVSAAVLATVALAANVTNSLAWAAPTGQTVLVTLDLVAGAAVGSLRVTGGYS